MSEVLNLLNPWWFGKEFATGIERTKYKKKLIVSLKNKRLVLLVGSRRVGKTTLLYQLIEELLKKNNPHHILYALVDHPQLSSYKILDLVKEFRTRFALDRKVKLYLFFDEIQYLKDWEQEVKALVDTENVKIFLSGSASANILLKSSHLTGRVEKIEIYPLDFPEFLLFKKVSISETESYKLEKYTDEYLKIGGYPEYVLESNPSYFSDLVNNILYKDIIYLYRLRNPDLLRDLFLLTGDRVGHITTYNKLAKVLSLKIDTVKEYMFYLKNTFLIDELVRASPSRSARIYGPKKFYLSDNGMLFHILGRLSYGAAFEQTLFHFLKKQDVEIGFFYENQKEVDFAVEKEGRKELWEAKYKEELFDVKLENYIKIARVQNAKKIVFVTKSQEKNIQVEKINMRFIPLWKLLAGEEAV